MTPNRSTIKNYPVKFKLILTSSCLFLYLNIGLLTVLPITTFVDLAYLVDSSFSQLSFSLTIYSISVFLGSVLGGVVFKVVDRRIGLVVLMAVFSAVCMSFPFLKSVPLFVLVMVVKGLTLGSADVALNSWILDLWGKGCNTYMQALHFAFGLGLAISPNIITPFMGLDPSKVANSTESSLVNENTFAIETFRSEKVTAKPLVHFQLVYVVAGIVGLLSAIIQLVLYFVENQKLKHLVLEDENGQTSQTVPVVKKDEDDEDEPHPAKKLALTLGGLVIIFYVGMEINSFRFVTEYVHFMGYDVETSGREASFLNTSYAVARFIGILISRFISTDAMVIMHLLMIMIGAFILMFQTSLIAITFGLIFFGAGCSVIFASVYSMLEERTHLSNLAVGLLTAGGILPSVLYPLIMPPILEKYPMVYVYNILLSMVFVVFGVIILIIRVPRQVKT